MTSYKCPRCGSTETYSSEENGRTFAVTLDTPSQVDPTMFHTMKETVTRCKNCGEKSVDVSTPLPPLWWYRFQEIGPFVLFFGGLLAFFAFAIFFPQEFSDVGEWLFSDS